MPQELSHRSSKLSSGRILVYILICTIAVFIAGGIIFFTWFFSISEIIVIGESTDIRGVEIYRGQNLFFISPQQIQEEIVSSNPQVASAVVSKKYPRTLQIALAIQKPIAFITLTQGFGALAENGRIIYKTRKSASLPTISFYQKLSSESFQPGDVLSFKEIQAALFFLKSIRDLGLSVEQVDINSSGVILCNLKNKTITFSTSEDPKKQVFWLGEIVKRFKIEGREFQSLDLKFDKPVIRF